MAEVTRDTAVLRHEMERLPDSQSGNLVQIYCNKLTIKSSPELRRIERRDEESQDGKEGAEKQASVRTPRQEV